jgi:hypothetical protein
MMRRHQVLALLEELGDYDDVAETLAERGVTGVRNDTNHCPIANFLRREGVPAVVQMDRISWAGERGVCSIVMPREIRRFVGDFDDGYHSELLPAVAVTP